MSVRRSLDFSVTREVSHCRKVRSWLISRGVTGAHVLPFAEWPGQMSCQGAVSVADPRPAQRGPVLGVRVEGFDRQSAFRHRDGGRSTKCVHNAELRTFAHPGYAGEQAE